MADIERLREGVRRLAMAEPVIGLAPFMGQVVDKAVEVYDRALNLGKYLHPRKTRIADELTTLRARGAFRPPAPRGAPKR